YDAVNKERKSSLALLGSCQSIYCSKENIYIASDNYLDDEDVVAGEWASYNNTKILRIALNNGNLSANGATTVLGQINNQFSMDEKDGIFRIATTITPGTFVERGEYMKYLFSDTYNKVYCLDAEMKVIGESEKLGVTERIKSVRYLGDIAYVVTFRQTDPLYAIDLTDPTNLKTLSALKIDGFSTYMQPYGTDYMLGIGYAADSDGRTNGIKLTMFDITNPADVFDISTTSFLWGNTDGMYVTSDALSNHKAILIDYKKGIIGLPFIIEGYAENKNWEYEYKLSLEYKLFSFDSKELAVDQSISIPLDEKANYWSGMRGLYIGDYLYIAFESGLVSVSLNDYSVVDTIKY
ncbi:MAG: beta-propeller domain-containing protein, partial [Clostridia bacterium]|nr:beta-propeller domain-containing protein [Clostridia bacterium]